VDEAIAWLERRLDRPVGSLGPSLRVKTPFEIAMFLDRVLPSVSATGVETACRWVLCTAATQDWRDVDGDVPADFRGLGERVGSYTIASPCVHPELRALVALGELVPPERQPVLVLAHPGDGVPAWVDRAARLLAELAFAQPRLACCLVLEPGLLRGYLDGAAESRAKAMVRESIVTVPDGEPDDGDAEGFSAAPAAPAGAALPSATGDGAYDPDDDDRARSAAERLLFDRLEAMPETAGLFRLNETIDLAFGRNRKMEIDLAAPALRLAVEVDGYYHFQDPEAYRRDRRKDLELQKHEYLVVRVLAEDVLAEPGQAIETILGAIAHRRGRAGASTGDHA
jgi:very-short-patch-repair endonuclease